MKRRALVESVLLSLVLALPVASVTAFAAPAAIVFVTNSQNSGPGSFRDAIDQANADPAITSVQFLDNVSTIELQQTVSFTGPQNLTIAGNGSTLDGTNAGGPAFRSTGGGNLAVFNFTVRNAPAEGISVDIPHYATGTIQVLLFNVDVIDNKGHGVLVDDQDDPSTAVLDGDSDASVNVSVVGSRFMGNGFLIVGSVLVSDRDGLRVNEGGDGDLIITILLSLARDNGADGIEVDERGAGDVRVEMMGSQVNGNGRHDPADLDDGFDIDENDDGSIVGVVFLSAANNNYEEGFDFNENHAGDLRVDMRQVEANGNGEEGIDYEEDDDSAGGGDLVTTMVHVTANRNGGDAGLRIRERGNGDFDATLNSVNTSDNLNRGTRLQEELAGSLIASITKAASHANGSHGIDISETSSGDFDATVTRSTSSNNGGAGVRADQQTPGVGSLLLERVTLEANTGGPTTVANIIVTVVP